MSKRFLIGLLMLGLLACETERLDEELALDLQGTWLPNLIIKGNNNYTPEKDSIFFFDSGRIKRMIVTKSGIRLSKLGNQQWPFQIMEGRLKIAFLRENQQKHDTLEYLIEHLSNKRLVLSIDSSKHYYERLIY